MAARALSQALSLSEEYQLSVWQVRALAELGILDQDADSDPSRFHQAREHATAAGMVGMVAAIDLHIGETIEMRSGPVAAYPTFLAADTQARQLQLMGLYAHIRMHIAECLLNADGRPLPGRAGPAAPAEVDDLIAEAIALGEKSKPIPGRNWFSQCVLGSHGDSILPSSCSTKACAIYKVRSTCVMVGSYGRCFASSADTDHRGGLWAD